MPSDLFMAKIRRRFFLFFLVLLPFAVEAASIEELRLYISEREEEIATIEKEIKSYQDSLEKTAEEANTLSREINSLNLRVKKLNADIRLTTSKVRKTEFNIEKLAIEIDGREKDITNKKSTLAELLRTIHELESETLVEILLSHEHISDFFGDLEYLSNLDTALQNSLVELRELKSLLEEQKSAEEKEETRLVRLNIDFDAQKKIGEGIKSEKSSLLKTTKEKEGEYQKLLSAKEKQRAAIETEIAEIETELRLLIDPRSLPKPREGVLAWPVESPVTTQEFGKTAFAKSASDVYVSGGHNGIDFRASIGTKIFAADGGEIIKTGNTDLSCPGGSYGKWILIQHPSNLATLYAHLSLINVSVDQSVERGDLIGYSGNSGYTTGPHLHFTVYDSRTIRFGPSKSGRCALLPYGGYLNPMDYL